MTVHFINLTNGLQAIEAYNLTNFHVLRIQSTWCEQHLFQDIMDSVSDEFLFHAALGHDCVVYDFGVRSEVPRAIWHGLEFVKFVLWSRWYDLDYMPEYERSKECVSSGFFASEDGCLNPRARTRLSYFKRYLAGRLCVRAITHTAQHDGDYEWAVETSRRL